MDLRCRRAHRSKQAARCEEPKGDGSRCGPSKRQEEQHAAEELQQERKEDEEEAGVDVWLNADLSTRRLTVR